eukprot:1938413-Pyramimonas_sp.AAC.1
MAQDNTMSLKIASDVPPRHPERALGGFRVHFEPPKALPKRPKPFSNLKKIRVAGLLAVSLPMSLMGLKMAPRWR